MRKIYPPLFVVFLLSLAVTASAQNECEGESEIKNLDPLERTVIGYVQSDVDPDTIPWGSYSYINVIVNDIFVGGDIPKAIDGLIATRKNQKNKPKMLLSIRDYDVVDWDAPPPTDHDPEFYAKFFTNTLPVANKLDGLDIEYPGTRGRICPRGSPLWDDNKTLRFKTFVQTVKGKKGKLDPTKTLMLTVVGNDKVPELIPELNAYIDFLKIETYHNGLYNDDFGKYPGKRYVNNPLGIFVEAFNYFSKGIGEGKVIMGVDLGNTVQVISTSEIENSDVPLTGTYDLDEYHKKKFPDAVAKEINPIKNLCDSDAPTQLNTFPWSVLSTYALIQSSCTAQNDWTRKFDLLTHTPWLYRKFDENFNPNAYYFVSYEDINSLSNKLDAIGKAGISITDVSFIDSNLLSIIHENKLPGSPTSPGNRNSPAGTTKPPNTDSATNAASPSNDNPPSKVSAIVGGVFGSLAASLLLLTAGFFWYRRKNPKTKEVPRGSFGSHTALKNEAENPVVQNTVIPVAPGYVTAMFDFTGKEENDLSFRKGDKIEVLEKGDGPNDWWVGRVNGVVGEFPGNYVKET